MTAAICSGDITWPVSAMFIVAMLCMTLLAIVAMLEGRKP